MNASLGMHKPEPTFYFVPDKDPKIKNREGECVFLISAEEIEKAKVDMALLLEMAADLHQQAYKAKRKKTARMCLNMAAILEQEALELAEWLPYVHECSIPKDELCDLCKELANADNTSGNVGGHVH